MHPKILEFYKNLKIEIEITELNLSLLQEKQKYMSTLIDKTKSINLKNDIEATKVYINNLKKLAYTLGKKIINMIYTRATKREKIIFKEAIICEKSAQEIIELYPKENFSQQVIYNITSKLNNDIAKIKLENNNIYNIITKKIGVQN